MSSTGVRLVGGLAAPVWLAINLAACARGGESRRAAEPLLELSQRTTLTMIELRGLPVVGTYQRTPFARELITRAELNEYLEGRFREAYPEDELKWHELLAKELGLLDGDCDLRQTLRDTLLAEAAGYYDPIENSLYIADWVANPLQPPIMAHEITHALQDAHFDLRRFLTADVRESDRNLAHQALVEGDATLSMFFYSMQNAGVDVKNLAALTSSVEAALVDMSLQQFAQPNLETPGLIREQLYFPYVHGARFVLELYRQAGWARVNQAFDDLPESSGEILHPQRYLKRSDDPRRKANAQIKNVEPLAIDPARLLLLLHDGWTVRLDDQQGEFGCRLFFKGLGQGVALEEKRAQLACEQLERGRVWLLEKPASGALAVAWVSDLASSEGAIGLQTALAEYLVLNPHFHSRTHRLLRQAKRVTFYLGF